MEVFGTSATNVVEDSTGTDSMFDSTVVEEISQFYLTLQQSLCHEYHHQEPKVFAVRSIKFVKFVIAPYSKITVGVDGNLPRYCILRQSGKQLD